MVVQLDMLCDSSLVLVVVCHVCAHVFVFGCRRLKGSNLQEYVDRVNGTMPPQRLMDPLEEFNQFALQVSAIKHLSAKPWSNYFDTNEGEPGAPAGAGDSVPQEGPDGFCMDQEVDAQGKPCEVDAEHFMTSKQVHKAAGNRKNMLNKKIEKDVYIFMCPSPKDPYPDKIWAVRVMQVNANPDDESTFVNGKKWHYKGKWFGLEDWKDVRSHFHACVIPKWQQVRMYETMADDDPAFDPESYQWNLETDGSRSKNKVQWIQYFNRTKWSSREMLHFKVPQKYLVRGQASFKLPENTLMKMAAEFPELELATLAPRAGFDAEGSPIEEHSASGNCLCVVVS